MIRENGNEHRIVIFTVMKGDAEHSKRVFNQAKLSSHVVSTLEELVETIKIGAGALLLAKEVLDTQSLHQLSGFLSQQPAWSHLPVIVLTGSGDISEANADVAKFLQPLKNVTLLERPVRLTTLLSILQAALADRNRQYETRDVLHQLERSNEALAQFAATASHDLQEPLRVIANYLSLIEKRFGDRLQGDVFEYFQFVKDAARRMNSLIAALLSYARVGAGQLNLVFVSTEEIVDEALSALQILIEEKKATISKQGTFPTLLADATQLHQLFLNLINNAIKFCRPGETPRVVIGTLSSASGPIFFVKDEGIGMPKEHVSKIFQVFKRLHGREYPGSGIGLAVCKKIVEHHSGRIWVEASAEKGSTFYFTLGAESLPKP